MAILACSWSPVDWVVGNIFRVMNWGSLTTFYNYNFDLFLKFRDSCFCFKLSQPNIWMKSSFHSVPFCSCPFVFFPARFGSLICFLDVGLRFLFPGAFNMPVVYPQTVWLLKFCTVLFLAHLFGLFYHIFSLLHCQSKDSLFPNLSRLPSALFPIDLHV